MLHHLARHMGGWLLAGVGLGACATFWGEASKVSEVVFTEAEAVCLATHANLGPALANEMCDIEPARQEAGCAIVNVFQGPGREPAHD